MPNWNIETFSSFKCYFNWNTETFSSFKCYFNFIDTNIVRFHFGDEFCTIKLENDIISIIDSNTTPNSSVQSVVDFYRFL